MSGKFVAGMLLFGGIIGGEFAIHAFLKSAAVDEVRPKLDADIDAVAVNGTRFEKPSELLADLRGLRDAPAHHTHPTTGYRILLKTSQGPLELRMCRDSQNPHEYWVFYSGFYSTTTNEIGRVLTSALDGI